MENVHGRPSHPTQVHGVTPIPSSLSPICLLQGDTQERERGTFVCGADRSYRRRTNTRDLSRFVYYKHILRLQLHLRPLIFDPLAPRVKHCCATGTLMLEASFDDQVASLFRKFGVKNHNTGIRALDTSAADQFWICTKESCLLRMRTLLLHGASVRWCEKPNSLKLDTELAEGEVRHSCGRIGRYFPLFVLRSRTWMTHFSTSRRVPMTSGPGSQCLLRAWCASERYGRKQRSSCLWLEVLVPSSSQRNL